MTNKEIVLNYFAQISFIREGKDHQLKNFICDEIVWHLPRSSQKNSTFEGYDGIITMVTEVLPTYYKPESLEFIPHSFIAEGDLVHFHFTLKAITVNDKQYENDYQILIKVTDGKVSEAWEYFDTQHLNNVLAG